MEQTLEQLEKEITALEKKYLARVDAVLKSKSKAFDPGKILAALCGAVKIAMPFLKIIKGLPFIGKKLKAAIQRIIDTAALACPDNG